MRIGVVDGLHTMRAVQWRLTVRCVCVCVRMLFVLVVVAACWCILAVRPDYARFSALMVAYDNGWHRDAPIRL